MTCETVTYAKPLGKPNNLRDVLLVIIAPFLVGWAIFGFWWGILLMLASLFGVHGIRVVMAAAGGSTSFEQAKEHLVAHGYQVDFAGEPWLAIDSQKRKIALVSPNDGTYDLYDLSDLLQWEHQWVDHETPIRSMVTNRISNVRISKINNRLIIKTKNPHKPRYEFQINSYDIGQLWVARLGALVNG